MRRRAKDAYVRETERLVAAEIVKRTRARVGDPTAQLTWTALKGAIAEVLTQVRREGLLDEQAVPMVPRVLCLVSVEASRRLRIVAAHNLSRLYEALLASVDGAEGALEEAAKAVEAFLESAGCSEGGAV